MKPIRTIQIIRLAVGLLIIGALTILKNAASEVQENQNPQITQEAAF